MSREEEEEGEAIRTEEEEGEEDEGAEASQLARVWAVRSRHCSTPSTAHQRFVCVCMYMFLNNIVYHLFFNVSMMF